MRYALLASGLGLLFCVALGRVIAETAPLTPQALTSGSLAAGGDDDGDAPIRIREFEDTRALVLALGSRDPDKELLTRHLEVEEAIAGQPLTGGNKVQLLKNGPNTYRAMFAALRDAKHTIYFESYIFDSDDTGKQFAELLLKKHAEGVSIALMVDGVGTMGASDSLFTKLREQGIPVLVYHPLNPMQGSQAYSPNMRDHRKLLVVDGAIGFTGGVNISSVYSSSPSARLRRHVESQDADHAPWRDTDIELEGPSVTELERLFQANWSAAGGPALQKPSAAPLVTAPEVTKGNETKTPEIDQAVVRIVSETPDRTKGHKIYATMLAQMAAAEHSIQITMAYFVPDPRLMGVLQNAARHGVNVQIILPSFSDSWAVVAAGRARYQPLLDAGVNIYERRGSLLHAKTAVIDGVWSTVGSSNLDWRSFNLNDEVNAVVLGRQFGAQMEALFAADLESATPITAATWQDRSYFERGREQVALLLQRWL